MNGRIHTARKVWRHLHCDAGYDEARSLQLAGQPESRQSCTTTGDDGNARNPFGSAAGGGARVSGSVDGVDGAAAARARSRAVCNGDVDESTGEADVEDERDEGGCRMTGTAAY